MALLVRIASNPVGAELLLQAGLMARLAEFSVLDLRPEPALLAGTSEDGGAGAGLSRYHSILFPVLRLCQAVLGSLGADNVSAAAQTAQFLAGHEEVVSLVLRGAAARSSLAPALLQELALLSAVVSRAAVLDTATATAAPDCAGLELAGQLGRLQRQMLGLLQQFQLGEPLVQSLAAAPQTATLLVLQIITNATAFARTLLAAAPLPRSTKLLVSAVSILELSHPVKAFCFTLTLACTLQ